MGALGTLLAGDTAAAVLGLGFLPVSLIGEAMLWTAAALTLVTGWDYLLAGLRHAAEHDNRGEPPPPPRRNAARSRSALRARAAAAHLAASARAEVPGPAGVGWACCGTMGVGERHRCWAWRRCSAVAPAFDSRRLAVADSRHRAACSAPPGAACGRTGRRTATPSSGCAARMSPLEPLQVEPGNVWPVEEAPRATLANPDAALRGVPPYRPANPKPRAGCRSATIGRRSRPACRRHAAAEDVRPVPPPRRRGASSPPPAAPRPAGNGAGGGAPGPAGRQRAACAPLGRPGGADPGRPGDHDRRHRPRAGLRRAGRRQSGVIHRDGGRHDRRSLRAACRRPSRRLGRTACRCSTSPGCGRRSALARRRSRRRPRSRTSPGWCAWLSARSPGHAAAFANAGAIRAAVNQEFAALGPSPLARRRGRLLPAGDGRMTDSATCGCRRRPSTSPRRARR